MTTRKVPPPPPDADLSPFEVGAYLAGHVPEYVVHSDQSGGKTQAERIELHRRLLPPEDFAEWLETENAKRTDVEPIRTVERLGMTGAMASSELREAIDETEKPPEIQAVHLEKVKALRKAEDRAIREREGSSKGGRASNLTGDDKALHLATKIRKREPGISDRSLAKRIKNEGGSSVSVGESSLRSKVAAWVKEGKIQKSVATAGRKPKSGRKTG